MKTYIVSAIIVLSLINLNSPQPILEPHRVANSDNVVVSFVKRETKQEFPDRTDAHQHAVNLETARQAKALQDAEAQRLANIPTQVENTPVVAPNGSCMDWIRQAGVTDVQSAYTLIMRESGCNPNAVNPSSGACKIPQALPCSKLPTNDPVEQIKWMQNYCVSRYGSWSGALAHSNSVGWY